MQSKRLRGVERSSTCSVFNVLGIRVDYFVVRAQEGQILQFSQKHKLRSQPAFASWLSFWLLFLQVHCKIAPFWANKTRTDQFLFFIALQITFSCKSFARHELRRTDQSGTIWRKETCDMEEISIIILVELSGETLAPAGTKLPSAVFFTMTQWAASCQHGK